MLTKNDLIAIKTIVKDEVNSIVKTEIKSVKSEISELRSEMEINNNTLVELITTGFASHEVQFDSHHQRISHLEEVVFKT
jgi:hypothetical protein